MSVRVVAKKSYSSPRPADIAYVKQCVIVEEDGERFAVVRLTNGRGEPLGGVTLSVAAFDENKRVIGKSRETVTVSCAPRQSAVCAQKIALPPNAVDCKVAVVAADYGDYTYKVSGGRVVVDYSQKKDRKDAVSADTGSHKSKTGKSNVAITARRAKMPVAVIVTLVLCLILAVGAVYGYLVYFKETEKTFLRSGVEYAFVDETNKDGDIKIVGYRGALATVTIPAEIEGHKVSAFEERAFENNTSLVGVNFEGDISIGKRAFAGCINLKTVDFDGVVKLGDGAFSDCIGLESVVITDKLELVPANAFKGCSNLKTVTVAESETPIKMGALAFANCVIERLELLRPIDFSFGKFRNSFVDSSVEYARFVDYDVTDKPEYIKMRTMFGSNGRVGTLVFDHLDFIPESFCADFDITRFEATSLTEHKVLSNAFDGCAALTEFVCSNKITEVHTAAFRNTALTEFDFEGLTVLGDHAFSGTALAAVDFSGNAVLTEIAKGCFASSALESVTLGASMTAIGKNAFEECGKLYDIDLGNNALLSEIGDRAFIGCASLEDFVFSPCETLTKIGEYAFSRTAIEDVTVPDGASYLGKGVFAGCPLVSLTSPFVGKERGSGGYLSFMFGDGTHNNASVVPSSLELVVLTDTEILGNSAFAHCVSIKNILLPENLKVISEYAFYECASLVDMDIPQSVEIIDDYAFGGCAALTEFTAGSNVVRLGVGAFFECNGLRSLTLPFVGESATAASGTVNATLGYLFGEGGYVTISGIPFTDVRIPTSLKSVTVTGGAVIGENAFAGCSAIENITLPADGLTHIYNYAFNGCAALTSLTVPDSVLYIGNGFIADCNSLGSLTVPFVGGERVTVDNYNYSYTGLQYMGGDSIRSLKTVTVTDSEYIPSGGFAWSPYLDRVVLDCSVNAIGDGAFDGAYGLYEVFDYSGNALDIGGYNILAVHTDKEEPALPSIESNGFTYVLADSKYYLVDCDQTVKQLDLEQSVNAGEHSFSQYAIFGALLYNNNTVESVSLPSSVTDIYGYAFGGCGNLRSVNCADGLRTIGCGAFRNCTRLKSFTLPASLQSIGESAFYSCYRLFEVFNLSDLNITAGSDENGGIARYAAVFDEVGEGLDKTTANGVEYYRLDRNGSEWWAVDTVERTPDTLTLLPFDYDGENVGKFEIYKGDLSSGSVLELGNVKTLRIGRVLKEIGDAFSGMYNVENIEVVDDGDHDCVSIADNAFFGRGGLRSVKLGKVARIGAGAFSGCAELDTLSLEAGADGLTIGSDAFRDCVSLPSFSCDGYIKSIGINAFIGCGGLKTVSLGRTGSIGESAFSNLSLTSLEFKGDIDRIGAYAFDNSFYIKTLSFGGAAGEIGRYAFRNAQSVDTIAFNGAVKSIGEGAFFGMNNVKSLTLPEGLTSIGNGAFAYCAALNQVTLPSTLTSLNESVFSSCYRVFAVVNKSGADIKNAFIAVPIVISDSASDINLEYDKISDNGMTYSFVGNGGDWHLYEINGYGRAALPDAPTLGGQTVQSYSVRNYAMLNGNYVTVMLPVSVKAVSAWSFGYMPAVYYKSDKEAFDKISGGGSIENVYYYSKCLHEDNAYGRLWRSDDNDYPTTSPVVFGNDSYVTVKEPTCESTGSAEATCPDCGRKFARELAKVAHDFENDECKMCGLKRVAVTSENFSTLEFIRNDGTSPYTIDKSGHILSSNTEQTSVSRLELKADRDITVMFTCSVSGSREDILSIRLPIGTSYSLNGGANPDSYTISLKAGETLSFEFAVGGATADAKAEIFDMILYYKELEEDPNKESADA